MLALVQDEPRDMRDARAGRHFGAESSGAGAAPYRDPFGVLRRGEQRRLQHGPPRRHRREPRVVRLGHPPGHQTQRSGDHVVGPAAPLQDVVDDVGKFVAQSAVSGGQEDVRDGELPHSWPLPVREDPVGTADGRRRILVYDGDPMPLLGQHHRRDEPGRAGSEYQYVHGLHRDQLLRDRAP